MRLKDNVYIAKEIFQEHTPLYKQETISGYELILSDHFSESLVVALTTNMIEKMSKEEKSVFKDFVKYEDYLLFNLIPYDSLINVDKAIVMDKWLYNEVMNIENKNLDYNTSCVTKTLNVCNFI